MKKLFYFQLNSLAPLTECVVCVVMLFVLSFVVVLLFYIVINTTKSAFTTWMWCAVFLVVFKSSLFCVNKYHSHHQYIPSIEYDYDTGWSTLFGYQNKSVKFEVATLRRAAAGWVLDDTNNIADNGKASPFFTLSKLMATLCWVFYTWYNNQYQLFN